VNFSREGNPVNTLVRPGTPFSEVGNKTDRSQQESALAKSRSSTAIRENRNPGRHAKMAAKRRQTGPFARPKSDNQKTSATGSVATIAERLLQVPLELGRTKTPFRMKIKTMGLLDLFVGSC
jgi:hypothetical protein